MHHPTRSGPPRTVREPRARRGVWAAALGLALALGASPAAAELAVKANWRNAADRLARVIERVGERGSW